MNLINSKRNKEKISKPTRSIPKPKLNIASKTRVGSLKEAKVFGKESERKKREKNEENE